MTKKLLLPLLLLLGFSSLRAQAFDPCDSTYVAHEVEELILEGFTCLEGAGPFACVFDVYAFLETNCSQPNGDCDSVVVAQIQADLIAQGVTCLEGAGPFACVNDIFAYLTANCSTPPGDPCDSVVVTQLQADLIADGFECLQGAGPFACVDDLYDYIQLNCAPIYQDCDSAAVAQTITDLLAQGFDCLQGAGPFTCVNEVIYYAYDNCPPPIDTTNIPACFFNLPQTQTTFQEFINWLAENCDSTVTAGIPQCWLDAPLFTTDEEYFNWLAENCEGFDSLMTEEEPAALAAAYFNAANTTSSKTIEGLNGISLSPNPATQWVRIGLKNSMIARVELSDVHGRVVYRQENVNDPQIDLNLENLAPGVYFARITDTKQQVATRKIVRQ